MHAVDLPDTEAIHQAVVDHRGGAGPALFRRLEDHDRIAGEIPRLGKITRRAEQHRGVSVVTTGMHFAGRPGGISEIGLFLDWKRVHVGAKPDHPDITLAGWLAALDDADHAGAAETRGDFVAAG